MKIVVTGATGFIGTNLVRALRCRDWHVRAVVRAVAKASLLPTDVDYVVVGDIGAPMNWGPILEGADGVVHLAGRAHALGASSHDTEDLYWRTNVEGTRRLAVAAARAGIKKFVFVSSSKAMGEHTALQEAWREDSPCHPEDPYGRSKLEAERVLEAVAAQTGLITIILRPPVVYGPGVGANILQLFRLIERGVPLPLGMVQNRRSLIYVGNLVDAIVLTLEAPSTCLTRFLVSDGQDVSTAELARRIGSALGRPARLLPVPPALLRAAGRFGDVVERWLELAIPLDTKNVTRLTQSLVLDAGRIRDELGWRAPYDLDTGLRETAVWYRDGDHRDATGREMHLPRLRRLREPIFKRPLDLLLSTLGLLVSAPLWGVIAASLWLEDGRPVFFRQARIGRYGQLFRVLKFRSMMQNPVHVEVQARKDDPRITKVGRILRRTATDELPQLWNIFVGDMSFVGPRAQPEKERVRVRGVEKEVYIRDVPGYELRQLVRPGLTGITQIFARRDIPHRHKFKYDLIYVRKVLANASRPSLLGDLKMFIYDLVLIFRSVWITIRGRWEI